MDDLKPCLGKIENGKHYFPVRIYYNHTDAGGIVYYANYLRIAEEARVAMFDILGKQNETSYNDVKVLGDFVVRTAHVEYFKSARFGDDLVIKDSIEEIGKVYIVVKQEIMKGEEVLVEVKTKIVFVSLDNSMIGKPQRIPEFWLKQLETLKQK